MYEVVLNNEAVDAINKPVKGIGGHQQLMNKLKSQLNGAKLKYDEDDLEKLQRYANDYGQGGFQGRFKAILKCI
jgi:hypothetical protein